MQFINNWIYQLTADWSATATDLPVPGDAKGRLGDGAYFLTLVNSADATEQTTWEIVGVLAEDGVYTVSRAQEGTAAQAWPAGTIIYSGLTAGTMTQFSSLMGDLSTRVAALEEGGGGGDNPLIAIRGRMVMDPLLDLSRDWASTTWLVDGTQTFTVKFAQGVAGNTLQLRLILINQSTATVTPALDQARATFSGTLEAPAMSLAIYDLLNLGGFWFAINHQNMAIPEEPTEEPPTDNSGDGEEPPA
jgi:hypothetical protein